ncbi:methenyltetrahydromethanopterin cyclohydrolase [Clostridia bacterium]|nr:methenyltetrahydromethanopterin cyclohydrolase [Clostridia bacterium]
MAKQVSINQMAAKIVKEEIIPYEAKLGVEVHKMDCGATLIDMGLNVKGSWEAGLLFTRVTTGDMATVQLGRWRLDDEISFAGLEIFTESPLIACLGSQIAGWQLGSGEFATIGSGPARAQAVVESDMYFEMTDYRDHNEEVVLCIQDIKLPSDDIAKEVAKECGVDPKNVYLLLAPSACLVGSIQVTARILEQVCHKMHEKGFPVEKVVNCWGSGPIAPVVNDEVKAMGRINDAILYGGEVEFWVDADDVEIAKVVHQLVSNTSSPYYPEPFEAVFEAAGKDFYYIDHDFHSIAKIQIHNVRTGKCFVGGKLNKDVIRETFLK